MSRRSLHLVAPFLALAALAGSASAAVHKTTVQSHDFPPPMYRTVTVRTVIDKASMVAPHTHPGLEMAYVLSGEGRLQVAGAAARTLRSGDSFSIPGKTVHSVTNIGAGPLTIVSTYVVDKSKPISSPAVMPR